MEGSVQSELIFNGYGALIVMFASLVTFSLIFY